MSVGDIRPNYYKTCGDIGCQVLRGWLTEERLAQECRDVIAQLGNDFDLGNALKYLWRAGKKDTQPAQDLVKARFYLKSFAGRCQYDQRFDPEKIERLIQKVTELIDA